MNTMNNINLVITGVGGQGTLLVTKILGEAGLKAGLNVTASEIHGMAQRGGVVVTTVRFGNAKSPLIADGDADILLGFEPVETLREIKKSSPEKTTIITNIRPTQPFTVAMGAAEYPSVDEIMKKIEPCCRRLFTVDMEKMADEIGIPVIAANILMLGILAGTDVIPIPKEIIRQSITENVPPKFSEQNCNAFDVGYTFGRNNK